MGSKRIGERLILDAERLSNKKLGNSEKRISRAVNRENVKCEEWIAFNPEHESTRKGVNLDEPRTECEEAEKRFLSSKTQCIRQSRIGLTTLNWRRRFDAKDEWGCGNPNTGTRKWLFKNHREHEMVEQGERKSENGDDSKRDKDSMSALS